MSTNCYIVLNIISHKLVSSIETDFLSTVVHYDQVPTISNFGQFDSLKEAREFRKKYGDVIMKGVE